MIYRKIPFALSYLIRTISIAIAVRSTTTQQERHAKLWLNNFVPIIENSVNKRILKTVSKNNSVI